MGARIEEDENIVRERATLITSARVTQDLSDLFSWSATASYFSVDSDLTDGPDKRGDPLELLSKSEADVITLTGTGTLHFEELTAWLGSRVLVGYEYESQRSQNEVLTAFGPSPPLDDTVRNNAVFGIVEFAMWERLFLSGGLRRDDNSFFGAETTASASAAYHLTETETILRGNYGEGFRAPTPIEFADPFIGNPDLTPEQSRSFDLGVEQPLLDGALTLSATWFTLETRDMIAWSPTSGILENIDRARVRGWEFGLTAQASENVEVRAYWTVQDPRNRSAPKGADDRLPGRPKYFGGGEVRYVRPDWYAGFEVYASGDYPASGKISPDGDLRAHPGRKLLFALRGGWQASEVLRVTGRIENVFADEYYDVEASPDGLGFGAYLGVVLTF